jgi:hypothetical protein
MDYRIPLIPKPLFPGKVRRGLEGVNKHMREEGENMKKYFRVATCIRMSKSAFALSAIRLFSP